MLQRLKSLLQKFPAPDSILWEETQTFVTPYTLDECLSQLQKADKNRLLSSLKWEWIENEHSGRKGLSFTCETSRSRVSLGLIGQIHVQAQASNRVLVRGGMLYSNVYFFLLFILIAPIFLASGTQPNLLGSYLASLLGTYVIMLIVGFIIAQVSVAVFDIASQQLFDDLKLLLKGAS